VRSFILTLTSILVLLRPFEASAQVGSEATADACQDSVDNDGDGAIDCADSDCQAWTFCAAPAEPEAENTPAACQDSIDNDGDGATDCADSDCAALVFCAASSQPPPQTPPTPQQETGVWMTGGSGIPSSWDRIGGGPDVGDERGRWYFEPVAIVRFLILPNWIFGIFVKPPAGYDMPNMTNAGAGIGLSLRHNSFELTPSVWWAGWSHDELVLGDNGDPAIDWLGYDPPTFWDFEGVSLLMVTLDFRWNIPVVRWLDVVLGFGLGAGFTLGRPTATDAISLVKNPEAGVGYDGPTYGTEQWVPCNELYGETCEGAPYTQFGANAPDEGFWDAWPFVDVVVGLRFRVHQHVAINVEGTAFGLFYHVGVRAGYVF
jgi:hypothetical protein